LGEKPWESFEKIKEYLVSPPVLRALKAGNLFKMYIAAQEWVVGAVLLQEEDGKEFPVAYISGRIGNWAYVLVEYDLAYELLRSMKGPIVADFIVDHAIYVDHSVNFVQLKPWGLYFDGLVCSKG
jgi:hypothetical protein